MFLCPCALIMFGIMAFFCITMFVFDIHDIYKTYGHLSRYAFCMSLSAYVGSFLLAGAVYVILALLSGDTDCSSCTIE